MKQKHFIDLHKGITGLVVLAMMLSYQQHNNPTAWLYLALHGTYGILWVLKSNIFPDKQWERPAGWGYGLLIWAGLGLYWVAPWLLMTRQVSAPGWYQSLCVSMFSLGLFLHFAADMQKYTTLKLQPDQLITDGLMSKVRNINYFGELLIYSGFGLLAMHWLPLVILLVWIAVVWLPNMRKKDRSLGRYPEFKTYQERTKLFIPFLF